MTQTTDVPPPATSDGFKDRDIAQARAIVGHLFPTALAEHLTTVNEDTIRNFAESYGDDNPLFSDEDYGVGTRWGTQIAPPLIGVAVNKPLLGDPRPKEMRRPGFRGIHVFVSGSSWELYRPVRPGDTLYQFEGFESVEEKQSEFAGRSLIITRRHVRMNQDAQVVSVARMIAIHTDRKSAVKNAKYSTIEPATYTPEDIASIDELYAQEAPRGAATRYWEDVAVGEAISPLVKGPLTTTDIVVFHAGGYGFTPYKICTGRLAFKNRQRIGAFYIPNAQGIPDVAQRVHWDSDWAQQIGTPMAYDYGILRDCWLTHALTDWMGDDGWLVNYSSQMRKFNYIGDYHRITGEVVGKRIDADRYVVDIELRGTNQRGEVTCPATATVALPSRDSGEVVLPEPPADLQAEAERLMARHRELLAESRRG